MMSERCAMLVRERLEKGHWKAAVSESLKFMMSRLKMKTRLRHSNQV